VRGGAGLPGPSVLSTLAACRWAWHRRGVMRTPASSPSQMLANPSLKLTPNGIAFLPRTGCRAHRPVRGKKHNTVGRSLARTLANTNSASSRCPPEAAKSSCSERCRRHAAATELQVALYRAPRAEKCPNGIACVTRIGQDQRFASKGCCARAEVVSQFIKPPRPE